MGVTDEDPGTGGDTSQDDQDAGGTHLGRSAEPITGEPVPAHLDPVVSASVVLTPYLGVLSWLTPSAQDERLFEEALLTQLLVQDPGPGLLFDVDGAGFSLRVDKPGSAQDCTPLFLNDSVGDFLVAVMDGMGGSGSSPITLPGLGERRPNAYFASRLVWLALVEFFSGPGSGPEDGEAVSPIGPPRLPSAVAGPGRLADFSRRLAPYLHDRLARHYAACAAQGLVGRRTIRGTLIRDLPTTLSMALAGRLPDGSYAVETFNCGDSRVYVMELADRGGLAWLTQDDVGEDADAMTLLREDLPMSSVVSASAIAGVKHRSFPIETPFLLFACSDGFHHYVGSPLDLEARLLSAMRVATASDPDARLERFGRALLEIVEASVQDDVTIALRFVGDTPARLMERFVAEDSSAGRSAAIEAAAAGGYSEKLWKKQQANFERYLSSSVNPEDVS